MILLQLRVTKFLFVFLPYPSLRNNSFQKPQQPIFGDVIPDLKPAASQDNDISNHRAALDTRQLSRIFFCQRARSSRST